ncbi:uncharacterized protein LOC5517824 [Nematostella vectensis]|uniref:uncharacterized protein LOC5517824 n=1 Tax=Nematostella vectensis TaxID=45351 RepID=UPI002076E01E|nr:uncharacterized protein LOC5517824 [Nematostella vectensis]
MADCENKIDLSKTLNDFLLCPEVCNTYTLNEFREHFPKQFRDHEDVKILYRSFQLKRKKIKALVRRNIKQHCASKRREMENSRRLDITTQSNQNEKKVLEKSLESINKEITDVELDFQRCARIIDKTKLFKGVNKNSFQLSMLQELCDHLGITLSSLSDAQ